MEGFREGGRPFLFLQCYNGLANGANSCFIEPGYNVCEWNTLTNSFLPPSVKEEKKIVGGGGGGESEKKASPPPGFSCALFPWAHFLQNGSFEV